MSGKLPDPGEYANFSTKSNLMEAKAIGVAIVAFLVFWPILNKT